MNANEIGEIIKQVLNTEAQRLKQNQKFLPKDWTTSLFVALTRWAYKDEQLVVWCKKNEVDATLTGCLYDFMISERGETPNDINDIWVVLESEWSECCV